jgi:hypothetical protein
VRLMWVVLSFSTAERYRPSSRARPTKIKAQIKSEDDGVMPYQHHGQLHAGINLSTQDALFLNIEVQYTHTTILSAAYPFNEHISHSIVSMVHRIVTKTAGTVCHVM